MGSVGHGKDISFYAHLYFPIGTKGMESRVSEPASF